MTGTGQFVRSDRGLTPSSNPAQPDTNGPDVTLDFVGADVRDVIRNVLGDVLHLSYAVDPTVQGAITLQTGRPIPRSQVLAVLESSLQLQGIALVEQGGVYRVLPLANAAREARLNGPAGSGIVTRTLTPQYVSAADLQRVLEPLLPAGSSVRADPGRNTLIVTGTEQSVARLFADASTFDVDYLRGMSFALLPLRNAQAKDVVKEVTALLGNSSTISGLVKVTAIDRLNAVLVTSMQPAYLGRVRAWVDQFDRDGGSQDRRLFVYRVQNGRASDLASVLRKVIGVAADQAGGPSSGSQPTPGFAPVAPPGSGNSPSFGRSPVTTASAPASGAPNILLGGLPGSAPDQGAAPPPDTEQTQGSGDSGIRVVADEANNALVIAASSEEYGLIEAALRRLDVTPLQVMIEATVAEVTLTDQLSYGLQYYIRSGQFQALFGGTTTQAISSTFGGFNFVPGYDFAFSTASGTSIVLQLLQQLTTVRVLSSPNLMVLNNQTASLQVGDQVPIATQSAVSTLTANAPVVNSIEYRDTGVILRITPRVNASGLVLLDLSQEISEVAPTTTSSLDSPTIQQRRVTSSVAVNDGQTIALGGLIRDSRTNSRSGIPVLQDIPLLGALFGTRNNGGTRTELVVLITPHVARNGDDSRAITDELRQKLPLTVPVLSKDRR